MGQKVNPISMRLGINRTWDSRWYAGKNEYSKLIENCGIMDWKVMCQRMIIMDVNVNFNHFNKSK